MVLILWKEENCHTCIHLLRSVSTRVIHSSPSSLLKGAQTDPLVTIAYCWSPFGLANQFRQGCENLKKKNTQIYTSYKYFVVF